MTEAGKTVFIIDDNEDMVEALASLLRSKRIHVISATDPKRAVRLAGQYAVDILLLDLKMPGLDGLDVLRMVRKKQPDVRVLVYTGYAEEYSEQLKDAHVDYLLKKPSEAGQLLRALEECVGALRPGHVSGAEGRPKAKLLVVDDEPEVCTILKENIEQADIGDFEIELAESGEEALDIAARFEPDLVFLDIKMPHMWGDELIERIERLPTRKPKGYFIITAVFDEVLRRKMTERGHLYITKPFDIEDLFERLTARCRALGLVTT